MCWQQGRGLYFEVEKLRALVDGGCKSEEKIKPPVCDPEKVNQGSKRC